MGYFNEILYVSGRRKDKEIFFTDTFNVKLNENTDVQGEIYMATGDIEQNVV